MNLLSKWTKILKQAEKDDAFSDEAKSMANSWKTCAVGSFLQIHNPAILKKVVGNALYIGYLLTPTAYRLGMAFPQMIETNNVSEAKKIFVKVHKLKSVLDKTSVKRLKR